MKPALAVLSPKPRRRARPTLPVDPAAAADAADLRHVSDAEPGIVRLRHRRGFRYRWPDGRPVRDLPVLSRIRALAIPPAWTDVWICPSADGHIQAVGRDARGRKQYRYHSRWSRVRDATKYARMVQFGRVLGRIRARVARDLGRAGLPRDKVLATVVRLLDSTLIRVGNQEYARHNGSYGLTTLRTRHVAVVGPRVRLEFRGKGGKRHSVEIADARLARIVRRCRELPGQELFQYLDADGARQTVGSADVNTYLRAIGGDDFTAKDFRTWGGTVLAAHALSAEMRSGSHGAIKRQLAAAILDVASRLGNTTAVCRTSYVHPDVVAAHADGSLPARLAADGRRHRGLASEERAVLCLLEGTAGAARRGRLSARASA